MGGRGGQGLPSGVCVDGRDVTQAVVKGPVGEEVAVLGAAGHHVFGRLWWQRCGAWGFGQGLVACGYGGEQGPGWRTQGLGLVILSQPPDPILLPRVPSHSVPSAGPALSLCSYRRELVGRTRHSGPRIPPRCPGQLDRQLAGWGQSVTQCQTVGQKVGKGGVGYHRSCPRGLVPSWQREPGPSPLFQVPSPNQTQETQRRR